MQGWHGMPRPSSRCNLKTDMLNLQWSVSQWLGGKWKKTNCQTVIDSTERRPTVLWSQAEKIYKSWGVESRCFRKRTNTELFSTKNVVIIIYFYISSKLINEYKRHNCDRKSGNLLFLWLSSSHWKAEAPTPTQWQRKRCKQSMGDNKNDVNVQVFQEVNDTCDHFSFGISSFQHLSVNGLCWRQSDWGLCKVILRRDPTTDLFNNEESFLNKCAAWSLFDSFGKRQEDIFKGPQIKPFRIYRSDG